MSYELSIVIPCFNSSNYVDRALDILLNKQGIHKEISVEIIIVDDGSEIPYSLPSNIHYQSIKVLRQENTGVSAARNLGINNASGEYILFHDSDDDYNDETWIFFAKLNKLNDIYFFNLRTITYNNSVIKNYNNKKKNITKTDGCNMLRLMFEKKVNLNICAGFYRLETLIKKNVLFNESLHHCEDIAFIIDALCASQSVSYDSIMGFNYRKRAGSAVNSPLDLKHLTKIHGLKKLAENEFLDRNVLVNKFNFFFATIYILMFFSLIKNKAKSSAVIDELFRYDLILKSKIEYPFNKIGLYTFILIKIYRIMPKKTLSNLFKIKFVKV